MPAWAARPRTTSRKRPRPFRAVFRFPRGVGGSRTSAAALAGGAHRFEEDDEPSLHVVGAGAVGAAVLDPEGHVLERPDSPDRVDVAEEEERRRLARQLDAEVVAEEARLAAERLELVGDAARDRPQPHGMSGGGLDLDELPEEVERPLVSHEVAKNMREILLDRLRRGRIHLLDRDRARLLRAAG